jgi:hypothetical protein
MTTKKRKHRPTSKEGEEHIKPFKPSHGQIILKAIKTAKVGATQEKAAAIAGLRPDQVWKRLSELETAGKIFNTGITRKLKSGVHGIVWQIVGEPVKEGEAPVINQVKKNKKSFSFRAIDNPLLAGL